MSTQSERKVTGQDVAEEMTYRQAIRAALADELRADSHVILLGEDIAAAGGSFKTTEGLLDEFGPARVIDTPISENGFVGAALGMAITGMRPVVEIMFADFLLSASDAIVNEIAKFRFMSGGQTDTPVTIRAIGGATGRFGTQHSATGESWYLQIPGLKVVVASSPSAAYGLLRTAIRLNDPVIFLEHKGMYTQKEVVDRARPLPPVGRAAIVRQGRDVTIVATLLMVPRALRAAEMLAMEGIEAEVIVSALDQSAGCRDRRQQCRAHRPSCDCGGTGSRWRLGRYADQSAGAAGVTQKHLSSCREYARYAYRLQPIAGGCCRTRS